MEGELMNYQPGKIPRNEGNSSFLPVIEKDKKWWKKIGVLFILFFVSCITYKKTNDTIENVTAFDLEKYNGPYYITITFFPKNTHLMIMGGVRREAWCIVIR